MRKRVYFEMYGVRGKRLHEPEYAMFDPSGYDSRAGAVAAAIARKNRLEAITVTSAGVEQERGRIAARHYQAAFGVKARYGGWDVVSECSFSVPT